MTDKQIIIDYKNLCENYSKEVGCFGTFDGSCIKEQCFTYKLLQKMQQLETKEQECDRLKEHARKFEQFIGQLKNELEAYKEIKEKSAIFTSEFTLACGAITVLEHLLDLEVKNENMEC